MAIRRIRLRHFDYSVRMGEGDVRYERHGLRSMAECLHDAATALGQAFRDVEVSYEGVALGCYSQPTLEHDPLLLARKLEALLAGRDARRLGR
ncbi:MAG: hypothetical protein JSR41_08060 [Proteobacteria bacterium]|nr:hypothetical protein [Pseudomonadota bacterium]